MDGGGMSAYACRAIGRLRRYVYGCIAGGLEHAIVRGQAEFAPHNAVEDLVIRRGAVLTRIKVRADTCTGTVYIQRHNRTHRLAQVALEAKFAANETACLAETIAP